MVSDITKSMDRDLSKLWEKVKDGESWHTTVHGGLIELDMTTATEQQHFGGKLSKCALADIAI